MAKELSDLSVDSFGNIIKNGNSSEEAIRCIRNEILVANRKFRDSLNLPSGLDSYFATDPNFAMKALDYFDSLDLTNLTTNSGILQGERPLDPQIAISDYYTRIFYQLLPLHPLMSTPSTSDYTLAFRIKIPLDCETEANRGFYGSILDTRAITIMVDSDRFIDYLLPEINERLSFEILKACEFIFDNRRSPLKNT